MKVLNYQLDVTEYTKRIKVHKVYEHKWEDNGPKLFNLISFPSNSPPKN